MLIADVVDVFMQAKRNDGLELPTLQKLQKACDRIREFSEGSGVMTLEALTLIDSLLGLGANTSKRRTASAQIKSV
jgi:hypothetical protein